MSQGKSVTIKDVAETAGVSVGTVSRVLNDKPVSAKAQTAVTRAIKNLKYMPNSVAQSMRTQSTRAVGLVVNDIRNPLYSGIASAMEERLRADGYFLLMASTANDAKRERSIIESLKKKRIDGLVVSLSDETDESVLSALKGCDFPIVMLDRTPKPDMDAVLTEHFEGMFKATTYLLDFGHRHIGLIIGGANIRPGRERLRGFREAFENHGLACPKDSICEGPFTSEFGLDAATTLLTKKSRSTAIIVGGNQIFSGVVKAVRALRLEVPEDLSLISCDDTDVTNLLDPAVTVISRNISRIGVQASELLLDRFAAEVESGGRKKLIPTDLTVRGSCKRIA